MPFYPHYVLYEQHDNGYGYQENSYQVDDEACYGSSRTPCASYSPRRP